MTLGAEGTSTQMLGKIVQEWNHTNCSYLLILVLYFLMYSLGIIFMHYGGYN